MQFMAQEEQA